MAVVTRFAPSPTGFLHIGGARTALFNWLYARRHGGTFLLRIEDTDRARSTEEAVRAILDGLAWLGLDWDGEVVHQFAGRERHAALADQLLADGRAYRCYCSPEELAEMRATARAAGRSAVYDGRWRERDPGTAPPGIAPVVRFKAPRDGATVIDDAVQGAVRVSNRELDDMILLRADGTPTYMLSVVVDDHDMGVTHVIRGDDHLTNAVRQTQLYHALSWAPPGFAHIPLIHGADGAKLSKRHGAVALGAYAEMGILPEAMRNALLRLGWSHGDDEIIETAQAIRWFDLDAVGRSAARFDLEKLLNLNAHYLRAMEDAPLAALVIERLDPATRGRADSSRLTRLLPELKVRARTLNELVEISQFLFAERPLSLSDKARGLLDQNEARPRMARLSEALSAVADWDESAIEQAVRAFADAEGVKLGGVAQPLRAALTGSHKSPGIFAVMAALGRAECLGRLSDLASSAAAPN